MREFELVVAGSLENGIGIKGELPWRLPGDMKYFKELTTKTQDFTKKNCCIMGKHTYFSIPQKFRPLPNRINIILSRNKDLQR